MSEQSSPYNESIPKDEQVCRIEFVYDGLTGGGKYRFRKEDPKFIDPLSVYAMACLAVLDEHQPEIIAKMNEFTEHEPVSLNIH